MYSIIIISSSIVIIIQSQQSYFYNFFMVTHTLSNTQFESTWSLKVNPLWIILVAALTGGLAGKCDVLNAWRD